MATRKPRATKKATKFTTQQRKEIVESLVGRTRFAQRVAGVQYGGKRDIFTSAGYIAQGEEKYKDFWAIYDRGDVGGRIVDMPARTTWRTPPEVVEEVEKDDTAEGTGASPGVSANSARPKKYARKVKRPASVTNAKAVLGETTFTDAVDALAKRLRLWHYFGRVDRLAGIGRYAVLFLGVAGADDNELKLPLEKMANADQLIYLSVYSEENAEIMELETNPGDPRFGLPRTYKLQIAREGNAITSSAGQSLIVHASRVIHIAEDLLEDDVYGRPRLKRVMNRLFDLEKIAASTAESYWQLVSRILQAKVDAEAEVDDDTLKEIDERLNEMIHDLRRQFTGQGVDLSWLSSETPDVSQVAEFYFSLIAGSAGIPKRILFGSELGELASTTDQQTYLGVINERQEQFAEPQILRSFIDRLITLGALPKPTTGEYHVVWPTLFELPETEKATANLTRAQAASALTPVGGDPMELVEIDADGDVVLLQRGPRIPVEEPPPDSEPIVGADGTEAPTDPNLETPPGE